VFSISPSMHSNQMPQPCCRSYTCDRLSPQCMDGGRSASYQWVIFYFWLQII